MRPTRRLPRKQRTRQHVIADQSVNYVERYIIDEGHTAQRLAADYGYDLILFTYDEEGYAEPRAAFLQLKASESLTPRWSAFLVRPGHPRLQSLDGRGRSRLPGSVRCDPAASVLAVRAAILRVGCLASAKEGSETGSCRSTETAGNQPSWGGQMREWKQNAIR